MNKRNALYIAVTCLIVGIVGIILTFTYSFAGIGTFGSNGSGGYLGGMMGGGAVGSNSKLISNSSLVTLVQTGEEGVVVVHRTNSVMYNGGSVDIVALASPDGKPNMTWEIDGLVNPTVVVRANTQITVDLVNTDWGYMHGFEITTTPPPYPHMSMMGISNQFVMMPLPERGTKNLLTANYYSSSSILTLAAGTYYYLCPVPGHAQQGMYGKFVVQ